MKRILEPNNPVWNSGADLCARIAVVITTAVNAAPLEVLSDLTKKQVSFWIPLAASIIIIITQFTTKKK